MLYCAYTICSYGHYYLLIQSFSHQRHLMVFHWILSDSKLPQVSRTILSILAILNNVVFWMVSIRPPTSKFSGIIVTFMFHSFFQFSGKSRYFSFFSLSFSFILWSAGTAKSTILQVLFFFNGLICRVRRVFANIPGDLDSIPVRVIPKTLKMVLDTSLLNTQQYKVPIEGKVEQSRERSNALPYTSV